MRMGMMVGLVGLLGCSTTTTTNVTVVSDGGGEPADASVGTAVDAAVEAGTDAAEGGDVGDAGVDVATVDASDAAPAPNAVVTGWPIADGKGTHPTPGHFVVNILSELATCATAVDDDHGPAGATMLTLYFDTPGGDPTLGTYALNPLGSPKVYAVTSTRDAACALTRSNGATSSGSITYTAIKGDHLAGSFDVMADAQHLTGTFDVPLCDAGDAGAPSCPP